VSIPATAPAVPVGALDLAQIQREWPEVLKDLAKISRATWVMAQSIKIVAFDGTILTLEFGSVAESDTFKKAPGGPANLRQAIQNVLGLNPQFKAQVAAAAVPPKVTSNLPSMPAPGPAIPELGEPATAPAPKATSKARAAEQPEEVAAPVEPVEAAVKPSEPEAAEAPEEPEATGPGKVHQGATYGEPLLREILGAKPVDDIKGGR
jgi:DNA polymerase-3 subunit gamma/tau